MSKSRPRDKLGLALAGGGFRASLFHVGVLHRLADLDILRYVEVISAVSGGSITAALYVLKLQEKLKPEQQLLQEDYKKIVCDLEDHLRNAIQENLRNRLLGDPYSLFEVVRSDLSLSNKMADLYDNYLFDGTKLKNIGYYSAEREQGKKISDYDDYVEDYNVKQINDDRTNSKRKGSVLTKLILNATSLNTGMRFWFSALELGEWRYGYIHRRDLLRVEEIKNRVDEYLTASSPPEDDAKNSVPRWIFDEKNSAKMPQKWKNISDKAEKCDIKIEKLRTTKLGLLRLARISAEKMLSVGGLELNRHRGKLAWALGIVCEQYENITCKWLERLQNNDIQMLFEVIDTIYLYRTARNLSSTISRDWDNLRLAEAVAASANFPPVFPPYQICDIYDDLVVSRLGLTDGGVYDNKGVIGLLNEDCNYIISSDTGSPPKEKMHVSGGRLQMLFNLSSIYQDSRELRMQENLREMYRVSSGLGQIRKNSLEDSTKTDIDILQAPRELQGLAMFSINSPVGEENELSCAASDLAKLRTDLDAFNDIEMKCLINHGFKVCGQAYNNWLNFDFGTSPKCALGRQTPAHIKARYKLSEDYPYRPSSNQNFKLHKISSPPEKIKLVISIGKNRFFRLFHLNNYLKSIFWLFYVIFSFFALVLVGGSLAWLIGQLADQIKSFPDRIYLLLHDYVSAAEIRDRDKLTIRDLWLVLFIACSLLTLTSPSIVYWVVQKVKKQSLTRARKLAKFARKVRIHFGYLTAAIAFAWLMTTLLNVTFAVSFLYGAASAFATVLLLACLVSGIAWLSYGLTQIYLKKTKDPWEQRSQ